MQGNNRCQGSDVTLRCYARDVYHSNAVFMLLLCNAVFMLLLCCLSLTCGRRHLEFNVATLLCSRIFAHMCRRHFVLVMATQCLCCCYVHVLSLTCVRRHFEFITATQCLCCCYVVYLSHVGAAILNLS